MFSMKWMINLVLLGVALFMGMKAHEEWMRNETHELVTLPEGTPETPLSRKSQPGNKPSRGLYEVVADKNLFAEHRTEAKVEAGKVAPLKKVQPKTISKKQADQRIRNISLYGVAISDDYKRALIQNRSARPPERRDRLVKVGDQVDDLIVKYIGEKAVVLSDGAAEIELKLYDPDRMKRRSGVKRVAGPTIINTAGGTKAKPGKQVAATTKAAPPQKVQPIRNRQPRQQLQEKTSPQRAQKATPRRRPQNRPAGEGVQNSNPFENLIQRNP